jgi:hypothetical protein
MTDTATNAQPAAATLVGSLATFPLLDVFDLLARTGSTGELQVVGHGVDRRLWTDRGDLLQTPDVGLLELACLEDGWFSFTASPEAPDHAGRTPLATVVHDVGAQVVEWRTLTAALPPAAVVRMSAAIPDEEVQIRADQWQVLSLVGSGRTVHDVVAGSPFPAIDTLRSLRELGEFQVVTVTRPTPANPELAVAPEHAPAPAAAAHEAPPAKWPSDPEPPREAQHLRAAQPARRPAGTPVPSTTATPAQSGAPAQPAVPLQAPEGDGRSRSGIMPPPISGDPWSTPALLGTAERRNGS